MWRAFVSGSGSFGSYNSSISSGFVGVADNENNNADSFKAGASGSPVAGLDTHFAEIEIVDFSKTAFRVIATL
jgi:hypothetical protein